MYYVHDKHVLVLGLGRSGLAAAKLLSVRGAQVTVADDKTPEKLEGWLEAARRIPRASLALGGMDPALAASADLVVVSPGVPSSHPLLRGARDRGVPVVGELELACAYCPSPILAVTGTNGKTTTVTMAAAMLGAAGKHAVVCGNIGRAFSDAVFELTAESWAVLEVSSFQLETIRRFRADVAVLLNITPDHLDRHGNLQAYVEAKSRIFENQRPEDAALLNMRDKYTPLLSGYVKGRSYGFGVLEDDGKPVRPGCYLRRGFLELLGEPLLPSDALPLPGVHNRENACAAALAASLAGAPPEALRRALQGFQGVEHRLEAAGEVGGVRFVNDSKATNVPSVATALDAVEAPVVLILGGRDKGGDFGELSEVVRRKVRRILALGEARGKVARQLSGACPVVEAQDLEEAVRGAFTAAEPGGTVLFSPGCASFDMFRDYEERGRKFKEIVGRLAASRKEEVGKP